MLAYKNGHDDSLEDFFAWMDELNAEAVLRDLPDWPLPEETAHSRNCWIIDFKNGLTPKQALDIDTGNLQ